MTHVIIERDFQGSAFWDEDWFTILKITDIKKVFLWKIEWKRRKRWIFKDWFSPQKKSTLCSQERLAFVLWIPSCRWRQCTLISEYQHKLWSRIQYVIEYLHLNSQKGKKPKLISIFTKTRTYSSFLLTNIKQQYSTHNVTTKEIWSPFEWWTNIGVLYDGHFLAHSWIFPWCNNNI